MDTSQRLRQPSIRCELKRLWKDLQKERLLLFKLLGQEELVSKFVPSLYGDQKIIQEAYNMFLAVSHKKEILKREMHDNLEFHLFEISSIKKQFYQLIISKCNVQSPSSMAALHGLHEYFESKIMEEAEDIPDEITKE